MEWWSVGVLGTHYSITPVLQYSMFLCAAGSAPPQRGEITLQKLKLTPIIIEALCPKCKRNKLE